MEFMAMVWGWIVGNAPLVFNTTYDYLVLHNVLNLVYTGGLAILCLIILGSIAYYKHIRSKPIDRDDPNYDELRSMRWNPGYNGFHEFLCFVFVAVCVVGAFALCIFFANVHSYILLIHAKNYAVVEHLIQLIR